jgi:hypothetical protein
MITVPTYRMKKIHSYGMITCVLLFLVMVLVLPVSGADTPATTVAPAGTSGAASATQKPMVTAMVSAATPTVGDPVTISGVATGGNLSAGVQIWVFAGNYVNVTTVPVNADGTFSKTYQTAGFPPATYYVFVQSPGSDGKFNIELETSGMYSGQVVDATTGALLFNFTGTGSVQDAAAASALSDALNRRDVDDVYTKTTFQLVAPLSTTAAAPVTSVPAAPAPTTKSPVSPLTVLAGLGLCGIAGARLSRKK